MLGKITSVGLFMFISKKKPSSIMFFLVQSLLRLPKRDRSSLILKISFSRSVFYVCVVK